MTAGFLISGLFLLPEPAIASLAMNTHLLLGFFSVLLCSTLSGAGAFYGDPPDATHPWAIHDMNRPQPPRVEPGANGSAPSDAIVLFSGKPEEITKWVSDKNGEPTKWEVKEGVLQCVPGSGYIRTKEEFADCQLHIEWAAPSKVEGDSQGRGNSGIFLMGAVEVQVLDNYNNPTYPDGFASSIYGINPPAANPLRAPGEWQSYDIVFRRPVFKDGKEIDPGYITVFVNGVLTQDHTPLEGGGGHMKRSSPKPFPEKGPLKIQDHGNPVRFRNIWYRPLPKRFVEGGEYSRMSEEATTKKRAEIAKGIREDAAKLEGQAKMLRLLESLAYADDEAARTSSLSLLEAFVSDAKGTPDAKIESKKGEILNVTKALRYLTKFKILPEDIAAKKELEGIVKIHEWEKKK